MGSGLNIPGDDVCAACGESLDGWPKNHKCDPKKIQRRDKITHDGREFNGREPTEAQRLTKGFEMFGTDAD